MDDNIKQWCRNWGGRGGHWPPQYLADQLTLFKPGVGRLCPPLPLAPPKFFTFRHHWQPIPKLLMWIFNEMFGLIKATWTSLSCYFFTQQQSDWLKKIVTTQDSWIRNWLLDSVNKIEVFNFKTKWCRKLQTDIMYKFLRFLK